MLFCGDEYQEYSSVRVTEQHYVGLIQSLQSENYKKFEEVMKGDSLYSRYFDPKPHQSPPNADNEKSPHFSTETRAFRGAGPTRLELATSGLTGRRSNQTELRSLYRKNLMPFFPFRLYVCHLGCKIPC